MTANNLTLVRGNGAPCSLCREYPDNGVVRVGGKEPCGMTLFQVDLCVPCAEKVATALTVAVARKREEDVDL
jgi:hypothetical protein